MAAADRRDKGRASVFLFDVPCYLCLQMRCVEAAAPAGYAIALRKSYRSLDGMNGDISGFCICISELCAVLVMVFL